MLEIKGHRIALWPDVPEQEVRFEIEPRNARAVVPRLRDVVADPARFRAAFAASPSVSLVLSNVDSAPSRFLGRFERNTLPHGPDIAFRIGFHPGTTASACRSAQRPLNPRAENPVAERLCERFASLILNPAALDEDGFIVDRPDFQRAQVFYLFPASERVSAVGEPVFLNCFPNLRFCRSGLALHADGYVVRPGVRLLYEFGTARRPKASWRSLDAQFRAVVDDIYLSGPSEARP